MPFSKGQSGNPNGRPKVRPQLTPALRSILGKKAPDGVMTNRRAIAEKLVEIALDGDIQAIKLIFERVDGKVPEPVEVSGPDGNPIESEHRVNVDPEEVRGRVLENLIRLGIVGSGEPD